MKTVTISRTDRGRVTCVAKFGKPETDGSLTIELTPDVYAEMFFSPDMPEVNMDEDRNLHRLRWQGPTLYQFLAQPSNERL